MRLLVSVLALVVGLASVGCRSDDGPKPQGDSSQIHGDGGVPAGDGSGGNYVLATIADVKTKKVAIGTAVSIKGVTVSAVDTAGKYTGDVFVQDPAGGPNSGLQLFGRPVLTGGGLSSDLRPGDTVDVVGEVVYFEGPSTSKFDGRVVVQLKNAAITKTGVGTAPEPKVLTVAELMDKTGAEAWSEMLVRVKGLQTPASSVDKNGQYRMVGGAEIGTDLFEHVPTANRCVDVTGIVLFFYQHRIHPRDATDITDSSECVAPVDATIQQLQKADEPNHPAAKAAVKVEGIVAAIDDKPASDGTRKGFWLQQSTTAAPWQGIYVYHQWKDGGALAVPAIGTKVVVTGLFDEYYELSQISEVLEIVAKPDAAVVPVPVAVDAAEIGTGAASFEQYEGVLVSISNVSAGKSIDNGKTGADLYSFGFTLAGVELDIKNDLYEFTGATAVAEGTQYTTVTGVVHWSFDRAILMPRSAADLVAK